MVLVCGEPAEYPRKPVTLNWVLVLQSAHVHTHIVWEIYGVHTLAKIFCARAHLTPEVQFVCLL